VTLTGHVATRAEHDAAVGAAWMASGVSEVFDNLMRSALTGPTRPCSATGLSISICL
jgi:hypothetical protein